MQGAADEAVVLHRECAATQQIRPNIQIPMTNEFPMRNVKAKADN
jgi:hypothetical protein